jgi:hypothetical protein
VLDQRRRGRIIYEIRTYICIWNALINTTKSTESSQTLIDRLYHCFPSSVSLLFSSATLSHDKNETKVTAGCHYFPSTFFGISRAHYCRQGTLFAPYLMCTSARQYTRRCKLCPYLFTIPPTDLILFYLPSSSSPGGSAAIVFHR